MPRNMLGLSLVELMVALGLGLLVTAGVLQIFIGSRQTFSANESLARVQENLRFSNEILKSSIRGASHFGFCGMRPEPRIHLDLPANSWQFGVFNQTTGVIGWEAVGTGWGQSLLIDPAYPRPNVNQWVSAPRQAGGGTPNLDLPAPLSSRVVGGSDVIIVRELIPVPGVTSAAVVNADLGIIELDGPHGIDEGELVLVTDCNDADLFRNRSTGNQLSRDLGGGCGACPGNRAVADQQWATLSPQILQVYRVRISAFYVGYNADRGEPGLYRMDLSGCPCGQTEEIVSGVENMQALYGYSMPASQGGDGKTVDAGRWLTADQVNDWWPVIGVRLGLLHRSAERAGTAPVQRSFVLGGTQVINPPESNMRHDASLTLALRNRVMFDD